MRILQTAAASEAGQHTTVTEQERAAFPRRCQRRKVGVNSASGQKVQRVQITILTGLNQAPFAASRRLPLRETLQQTRRHGKAETSRCRGTLRPLQVRRSADIISNIA